MLWTVHSALVAMAALAVTAAAVTAWRAGRGRGEVEPSQLAGLIDRADRLVVRQAPYDSAPVLFESADRRDLDALKAALRVKRPDQYEHCRCDGTPAVYLYAGGEEVGRLTNHHAKRIRCSLWDSDATLLDADAWLAWFDARNIPSPRKEYEDGLRREKKWEADEARWLAAMPAAVRPLWPAAMAELNRDYRSEFPVLRAALERDIPDQPARIRTILAWFGSGAGPWSGFPHYESVAERLLLGYPTAGLVAAVEGRELTPAETEGAARLFGGWDFSVSRPDDLKQLSPELRVRLLAHSLATTDEDKRGRARRAFAAD